MTLAQYNREADQKSNYSQIIRSSPYFSEYAQWKKDKGITGGVQADGYFGDGNYSVYTDQNDYDWYNQFAKETHRDTITLESVPSGLGNHAESNYKWREYVNDYWRRHS